VFYIVPIFIYAFKTFPVNAYTERFKSVSNILNIYRLFTFTNPSDGTSGIYFRKNFLFYQNFIRTCWTQLTKLMLKKQ